MKKITTIFFLAILFTACTEELVKPKEGSDLDPNGKRVVSSQPIGAPPLSDEGASLDPDGKPRGN